MKIMAFDLGTQLGWAAGNAGERCEHGSYNLRPAGHDDAERNKRFWAWINLQIREFEPDLVVFEDVKNHSGVIAAHVYGFLKNTLILVCSGRGVNYRGYGVGDIKKSATGKGNAKKEAMIEAARAQGYKPKDDNAADAIAIFNLASRNALGGVDV